MVRAYLAEHGDRIVLHYLPTYSPNENPIERVWWHLHEQITRNHSCRSIEALVNLKSLTPPDEKSTRNTIASKGAAK